MAAGIAAPRKTRLGTNAALAAACLAGTVGFEGQVYKAYYDPVGIPTVCAGVTKGVRMGMVKTPAECDALNMQQLIVHEAGMRACLGDALADRLPDGAYVAFVDFTYNAGVGAFCTSTAKRKLVAGDIAGACDELPKWNKARKAGVMITLPGLTKRRAWEQAECRKGL